MSNDYKLEFDLSLYETLDNFALLADQKYNLGDRDDWFLYFRGGLYGLYSRVLGVQIHYQQVHSWIQPVQSMIGPQWTEYHLSSILFNMDSAIECMVFALNALGCAASLTQFKDVADEQKLKQISPSNILGKPPKYSNALIGYDNYFPSLKSYWCENRELLYIISEQHDVSKHRSQIFTGSNSRKDPPPGFYEKLGIAGDKVMQALICPAAEILLTPQPKTPWRQRQSKDYKDIYKLENIAERFCTFVNMSGKKALEDVTTNIKLNHYDFIRE